MRDATQKEQGRHILSLDANTKVQADLGTVAGLESPDQFAPADRVAFGQCRANRLVARQDRSRMPDRENIPVDDEADEVHDPVGRRIDPAARLDVDPAMSGRILRGWRQEGTQNLVRPTNRPRPARLVDRCGRRFDRAHGQHEPNKYRETNHPSMVGAPYRARIAGAKEAQNRPEMRPVGDRCYPFGSTESNPGDYACPLFHQRNAHNHSVLPHSSILGSSLSRSRGRVRAPGFAPNGADNN
jgi:hypothetical protein